MKKTATIFIIFCSLISFQNGAKEQLIKTKPVESKELFANPNMGWQTFYRFANKDKNLRNLPTSSAYFRFYWKDLEPKERKIKFKRIDTLLASAKKNGQKLALRICCAGFGKQYMFVPKWLKKKGCKGFEYIEKRKRRKHWIPDMNDPLFQKYHFKLIEKLGEKYNGHTDIDFLDIGTVGMWGEWHMKGTKIKMPSHQTKKNIIDAYIKSFPTTPKIISINDREGMRYAISKGCGWRADHLGNMGGFRHKWNHMKHMYPLQIKRTGAVDAWKKAPVIFENYRDIRQWKKREWDIRSIFNYALNYHASYINNKSKPLPAKTKDEVEQLLRKLGYRLVLRELEHNATVSDLLSLAMIWENVGVAPPYHDYYLSIRLKNEKTKKTFIYTSKTSIKGWLPGKIIITENITLPKSLANGSYKIKLAIVDKIRKVPAINIAITNHKKNGWYSIGSVIISR